MEWSAGCSHQRRHSYRCREWAPLTDGESPMPAEVNLTGPCRSRYDSRNPRACESHGRGATRPSPRLAPHPGPPDPRMTTRAFLPRPGGCLWSAEILPDRPLTRAGTVTVGRQVPDSVQSHPEARDGAVTARTRGANPLVSRRRMKNSDRHPRRSRHAGPLAMGLLGLLCLVTVVPGAVRADGALEYN